MTPLQHLQLLLRFERTLSLRRVIAAAVRPGDRVLDAGCGLGILSQFAAQCGAQVTAVDLDDVDLARRLAKENQLEDRIEYLQTDLAQLAARRPELENAFDVIIAMIYLNDPRRDENQSRLAHELRRQFLKPGGHMIPTHLRYEAESGEWPGQDINLRRQMLDDQVQAISRQYGLQFERLNERLKNSSDKEFFPARLPSGELRKEDYRTLGKSLEPWTVDYRTAQREYPPEVLFRISGGGEAHVVLWTQNIMFDEQLIFRNESVSWIDNPLTVQPNQLVAVSLDAFWRSTNCVRIRELTLA